MYSIMVDSLLIFCICNLRDKFFFLTDINNRFFVSNLVKKA